VKKPLLLMTLTLAVLCGGISWDLSGGTAVGGHSGTVLETMNSGGYTYIKVDTGDGEIWAAAPQFAVEAGDRVSMAAGLPMEGFRSKTLDQDFDVLYMVDSVTVGDALPSEDAPPGMPAGHPAMKGSTGVPAGHPVVDSGSDEFDLTGIEKAAGGFTVEDLYANRSELAGQRVKVRGKVVKFTPAIMGTNFAHLRDGTGDKEQRTDDLTVTTDETLTVGQTVTVEGMLAVDKDFGYGYHYEVIMEKATVAP